MKEFLGEKQGARVLQPSDGDENDAIAQHVR
jgi:hypothetical protein